MLRGQKAADAFLQALGIAADGGQRGPQLVRNGVHEVALEPIQLLELLVLDLQLALLVAQLRVGLLELGGALLDPCLEGVPRLSQPLGHPGKSLGERPDLVLGLGRKRLQGLRREVAPAHLPRGVQQALEGLGDLAAQHPTHQEDLDAQGEQPREQDHPRGLDGARPHEPLGIDDRQVPVGARDAPGGHEAVMAGIIQHAGLRRRRHQAIEILQGSIPVPGDVEVPLEARDLIGQARVRNETPVLPEEHGRRAGQVALVDPVDQALQRDVRPDRPQVALVQIDGGDAGRHPELRDLVEVDAGPAGLAGRVHLRQAQLVILVPLKAIIRPRTPAQPRPVDEQALLRREKVQVEKGGGSGRETGLSAAGEHLAELAEQLEGHQVAACEVRARGGIRLGEARQVARMHPAQLMGPAEERRAHPLRAVGRSLEDAPEVGGLLAFRLEAVSRQEVVPPLVLLGDDELEPLALAARSLGDELLELQLDASLAQVGHLGIAEQAHQHHDDPDTQGHLAQGRGNQRGPLG
ncbi:hypothetical protein D3C86_1153810 [compost metagenome]